jgi:hypothetical protein
VRDTSGGGSDDEGDDERGHAHQAWYRLCHDDLPRW